MTHHRIGVWGWLISAATLAVWLLAPIQAAAQADASCPAIVGRVVSKQGDVQFRRANSTQWQAVPRLDHPVCQGDQFRTGLLSRAGLYINAETIVRLDQNTTLEFVEQTPEQTVIALRRDDFNRVVEKRAGQCGVGYFITRFPRKLKVRTPFYNAVVEGTEFQVAMSCERGELAVFEGKVTAEKLNAPGERLLVEGGQSTSVGAGERPTTIKTMVRPTDAVQWALYYLPLSDVKLLTEEALAQDCTLVAIELRSACAIRKAEYLLRVGRVADARALLTDVSNAEPHNGDVLALQSTIALVQNEKVQALDLARRAAQVAPNAPRSFAALSYMQQAHFKLEDALVSAQRAAQLAPRSALMKARTAELLLSLGKTRAAERDATEAVQLDPNESRAHLILGFVHLARLSPTLATADFFQAIELDSTEPLARLGLGLATIREGKLVEGRRQIEIAVALDPANSLIRSYVGKAYYEENSKKRDDLAAIQFHLAKLLDPKDPTPWFYEAILRQTENRPVDALESFQRSIMLNDNRAVYRSKLGLDEDRAVRAASLGRAFLATGFQERARLEAYKSLASDPTNASAHRLLADSYATEARLNISRQSELLQAQIREFPSADSAMLQTSAELVGSRAELRTLAAPEDDRLPGYYRTEQRLDMYALAGSQDTVGIQVVGTTVQDKVSANVSFMSFDTHGYRENNAETRRESSAVLTLQPNDLSSIHVGGSILDRHFGDLSSRITDEAQSFSRGLIRDNGWVALRTHLDYNWDVVVVGSYERRVDQVVGDLGGGAAKLATLKTESIFGQFQSIYKRSHASLIAGGGTFSGRTSATSVFDPPGSWSPRHTNAYLYGNINPSHSLTATVGLSFDDLNPQTSAVLRKVSPKLGLALEPRSGTVLRVAYIKGIKREINTDQALEPTQIVGFNQFVDDVNASRTETRQIAIDQTFGTHTLIGGELRSRRVEFPVTQLGTYEQRENEAKVYIALLATQSVSIRTEIRHNRYLQSEDFSSSNGNPRRLSSWFVPTSIRYDGPTGMSLIASAEFVHQDADTFSLSGSPLSVVSNFWTVNVGGMQQLPQRKGSVWLQVRNLFDKKLHYQDIQYLGNDPTPRQYAPRLEIMAGVKLSIP